MPGEKATNSKKGESGAQLLARLSERADLSSIDPLVFSQVSGSEWISTKVKSQSTTSKIIEIYGAEGVGKSELVLYYIAKICLPYQWRGLQLEGLQAKVLFIDTDYKFSVLRLAIVLEKQILACLEKSKQSSSENDKKCDKSKDDTEINKSKDDAETSLNFSRDSADQGSNITGHERKLCELSPQDIEELVQDSLCRVQVMRVSCSQQLVASLLSLEQTLSNDPLISLVAIDSISAFYWMDKSYEPEGTFGTDSNMSNIARIISRYFSDLGITFLVVKAALIGNKKKAQEGHQMSGVSERDSLRVKTDQMLGGYSEFLGKAWASLCTMKIVLTKTCDGNQKEIISAACSDWQVIRKLTFINDSLVFL